MIRRLRRRHLLMVVAVGTVVIAALVAALLGRVEPRFQGSAPEDPPVESRR